MLSFLLSLLEEEATDSAKIAAFCWQNDDEDLVFMYNAYLHKLMTSFLSQPAGREKASRSCALWSSDYYLEVFVTLSSWKMTGITGGRGFTSKVPAMLQPNVLWYDVFEMFIAQFDLCLALIYPS